MADRRDCALVAYFDGSFLPQSLQAAAAWHIEVVVRGCTETLAEACFPVPAADSHQSEQFALCKLLLSMRTLFTHIANLEI
eukprot:3550842-Karenia_brevis.AAC.1